jgi:hypothetical protein
MLPTSLEAFQEALRWASRADVFWLNRSTEGRHREPNRVWVTFHPTRIDSVGVDEIRYIDTGASAPTYPLQEALVGNRVVNLQVEFRSRSQEPLDSAWWTATRTQLRIRHPHVRRTWLDDACIAINDVGQIIDGVGGYRFDDRIEDRAIIEITLNAVINEVDESLIVSCIETIEATSDLKNVDGNSLDTVLQLDDEAIPS